MAVNEPVQCFIKKKKSSAGLYVVAAQPTFSDRDPLHAQELAEPRYLVLQLTDHTLIGIFINHSLANNLLGTVCIPVVAKIISIESKVIS